MNTSITASDRLFDTLISRGLCYSENLQIEINVFSDSVVITDIADAMKPGKICPEWVFMVHGYNNPDNLCVFEFVEIATSCDTMGDLMCFLRGGRDVASVRGLEFFRRTRKSNRTFSPFYVPGKFSVPSKWNIRTVVKAIMAGAVVRAEIDGIYTDDYALDAAHNFFTGNSFDLVDFAKQLTERPGGWSVFRAQGNEIHLACHTFDYRTLYV